MSTLDRIAENPFYVLGLAPGCARAEIEREGQKLIGMLELGLSAAKSYTTPLGPRPRTADDVRRAMAELRDPEKRLSHELWARLPARSAPPATEEGAAPGSPDGADARLAPWTAGPVALGWKAR